jgi:hypothetical protein
MVTNGSGNYILSAYHRPVSTPEYTFTVQEELVSSWPDLGLPTDYWTRPIDWSHREWWPILGDYPADGYQGGGAVWDEYYPDTNPSWSADYCFYPWVQGPNSAHVAWTRQSEVGGLIGGTAGTFGYFSGANGPNVVFMGRAYDTYDKPGVGSVAACYSIQTGEIYYEIPVAEGGVTPQYVAYDFPGITSAIGAVTAGSGLSCDLITISGGRLMKIDRWTGQVVTNVSIDPMTGSGGTFHNNQQGFVLGVQNLGGGEYRLINWTTEGSTSNFQNRIVSNTSYARSNLPDSIDWNIGIGCDWPDRSPPGIEARYGAFVLIYNLYTGELMHNVTLDWPDTKYSSSASGPVDHGKIAEWTQYGYYVILDAYTGRVLFRTESADYPWGESGFGVYGQASAYGLLFSPR